MAQSISSDSSATTLTAIKRDINIATGVIRHQLSKFIFEETRTIASVADQQAYQLPVRTVRIAAVTYTSGSIPYVLREVADRNEWQLINESTTTTSTYPEYFYVDKDQIHLYPTPNASADTITMITEERVKDMDRADYTAGTVTVTNGDATVIGATVAFSTVTNIEPGDYFKANNDGLWYEIASITDASNLELQKTYEGTTLATQSYTIGEQALGAYEDLHILPVWWALSQFYATRRDENNEIKYMTLWNEGYSQANENYSKRTATNIIPSRRTRSHPYGRANAYPINVT